jgi:hypothetical protein
LSNDIKNVEIIETIKLTIKIFLKSSSFLIFVRKKIAIKGRMKSKLFKKRFKLIKKLSKKGIKEADIMPIKANS